MIEPNITDITLQWELAERLTRDYTTHEEALRTVFEKALNDIIKITLLNVDKLMRERVWVQISPVKLAILKETLILAVCDKVLSKFQEKTIGFMLEEHKKYGKIVSVGYTIPLQSLFHATEESIGWELVKKTCSVTSDFVSEIMFAINNDGIIP